MFWWFVDNSVDFSLAKNVRNGRSGLKNCVIQRVGIIYSIDHLELRSKTDFSTPLPRNPMGFRYTFQLLVASLQLDTKGVDLG